MRVHAAAGATAGLLLLARPGSVLDAAAPAFPRERRWVVRVLGARLLVQHATVLVAPDPRVVRLGAAVDLLHAASVLPVLASARYGRAAGLSGAVAAGSAVVGEALARSVPR